MKREKGILERVIGLAQKSEPCIGECIPLVTISASSEKFVPTYVNIKKSLVRTIYYKLPFMVPLFTSMMLFKRGNKPSTPSSQRKSENLGQHIEAGDYVVVLSQEEIKTTLDKKNKLKGLGFMPEMEQYCGRKFKVLKKASRIMIESTGEMRILKQPVFLLEGAYCDGESHGHCDRSCFLYWREEWLKKVQ